MSTYRRSTRIDSLCKYAYRLQSEGKKPDEIVLLVKSKIVQMGVSAPTARQYFDAVVQRVSK